ncbi:acetyl-coenzyme A transporter 1-like isoform X2 [Rhopalosiphum padi]|uniref:acetyl-coenzyme A transporter 1-like isoform X2 n=1 Tax=Rhopalosiphum padi TaxID=40932 RepID=UPI00298EB099|nr:acetyl-coenzyme A transporter 1-like isoform X2 [Rhopalosiphum padi]
MILPIQEDEPTKSVVENELILAKTNLKGDWPNIFLLLLLYIMQGVPLGLVAGIPILLQSKQNVTYNEQALIGLAVWPFSLKLLWAPLVDSLYIQNIGRRKSWLIPIQFLIGICFFYMALSVDELFPETDEKPNIIKLAFVVFICTLLAATQDIAVDGWALTLLQKNNVGYASTCAAVGSVIGTMLSAASFILLTSEDFSNKYFRITPYAGGIVTMKSLFLVWAISFVAITIFIAIFKNEKDARLEDDHIKLNTFQNYRLLWDILKLPNFKILSIALLTSVIGFAPSEKVVNLKLIEIGVPKDNIMIILTGMYFVSIIIPVIAAKYTAGPKPMSIFLNCTPIKLLLNFMFLILIYYGSKLIKNNGVVHIPMYYYTMLVIIRSINNIQYNIMLTALVAFYCRISDARFGGTYMTLLNSLSNIGNLLATSVSFAMVDLLTVMECSFDSKNNCSNSHLQNECKSNGGDCITTVNGYYVESVICTIIGIVWYIIFKNKLEELQSKSPSHWVVKMNIQESENHVDSSTLADVKT